MGRSLCAWRSLPPLQPPGSAGEKKYAHQPQSPGPATCAPLSAALTAAAVSRLFCHSSSYVTAAGWTSRSVEFQSAVSLSSSYVRTLPLAALLCADTRGVTMPCTNGAAAVPLVSVGSLPV